MDFLLSQVFLLSFLLPLWRPFTIFSQEPLNSRQNDRRSSSYGNGRATVRVPRANYDPAKLEADWVLTRTLWCDDAIDTPRLYFAQEETSGQRYRLADRGHRTTLKEESN